MRKVVVSHPRTNCSPQVNCSSAKISFQCGKNALAPLCVLRSAMHGTVTQFLCVNASNLCRLCEWAALPAAILSCTRQTTASNMAEAKPRSNRAQTQTSILSKTAMVPPAVNNCRKRKWSTKRAACGGLSPGNTKHR